MSERMPQGGLPLVLLGGDGQEATRWLKSLLEGGGYAVLQERSAQHVLERARSTEPDMIIVDAELPDMPGAELCRTLRADPRVSSSTPILLAVREPASRAQRLAALRAGAWECITPPHDADEILLKLGSYVRAKLDADRARARGTDAGGARRLAERLAGSVSGPATTGEPAAAGSAATPSSLRVRCGYEAVANVGYAPIEPIDLLVRAAAAVRTGKMDSGNWLRRFDEGIGTTAP